jgi:GntR family transcriptional regulator, transcriptional repressor for pyruvate dehydrogenase complex
VSSARGRRLTVVSSRPASKKAWELVVEWIEERILGGEYTVGSQLPAERELAQQVGVSRSAVREAVRALEASGVLRSSVGAGATGGTRITGMPHTALTRLLRLHVALASFPTDDVTEVRVALERLSTRLASRQASAEGVALMRELVDAMDDDALTMAEFNNLDTRLHVAIAEAAGNRLASDLTIAIRESMRLPILAGIAALDRWEDARAVLRAQHRGIVDAIAAQEAEHAVARVEEHIRTAYERMTSLHPDARR